jgi:hypothetical protein
LFRRVFVIATFELPEDQVLYTHSFINSTTQWPVSNAVGLEAAPAELSRKEAQRSALLPTTRTTRRAQPRNPRPTMEKAQRPWCPNSKKTTKEMRTSA